MLDLRRLSDLWTDDGARAIFAHLVTHCVRSIYPSARQVRPDPGDEGVDTFVGEFDGSIRVYQAKYFRDGISASQQAQIRESWKSCITSAYFKSIVSWTLCVPIDLSPAEEQWWQRWSKTASKQGCHFEIWTRSHFESFSLRPELRYAFGHALNREQQHSDYASALEAVRSAVPRTLPIRSLPKSDHLRDAVFVRKLEAAGVRTHRSARTAFYNFELLRHSIEQGGLPSEANALEDLQERILALWETAYNAQPPERLGKEFYSLVLNKVEEEDNGALATALAAHVMHKAGGLHHWADLCEAGWTADFRAAIQQEDPA